MAESIISPGVFQRENDISFIQPAATEVGAAIVGPTVKGPIEVPTQVNSYNEYTRLFGTTFEDGSDNFEYLTSIAVKSYFDQGGSTCLVSRVVKTASGWAGAGNTHISSSNNASVEPFELKTLGKGTVYNNATSATDIAAFTDGSYKSGSADNFKWEVSNIDAAYGTFSLSIRRGDDTPSNKIVLETFNNLSLDPNNSNYVAKAIGNQVIGLNATADGINQVGDFANKSNYVYVAAVNSKTLNYIGNDGLTVGAGYADKLPAAGVGGFFGATETAVSTPKYFGDINASNSQGLGAADYTNILTLLGNKDDFQFNVLSAPGVVDEFMGTVCDQMVSLVESRGDAIAVIDLKGYGASVAQLKTQAATFNSSYAASYWPWLQMSSALGKNVWVPASTVIPGVFAFTDGAAAPWFAPAGLVRGGLVGVLQAEKKLTRTDRDTLYNGKVNPIATFPGTGIAVFGQKTLQTKASALDRVNVRRLLIELKEFVGNQSKNLVFEQNTIATRNRFLAAVNPYLESVTQRQGLYAYRVVMDDTNNTADVVDRNQLVGQIFIQPAKTAEFIVLDFVVEPTGATFGA
jgi:hypothetical protein